MIGRSRRSVRIALLAAALAVPAIVIATQLYVGYRLRGISVSTYLGDSNKSDASVPAFLDRQFVSAEENRAAS